MLLCAALAPVVHAEVIECPKFYPWQDTPIAEVPYRHKGQGFLAKSKLLSASMFTGEIDGKAELVGEQHKVKGGWDVHHGFTKGESKWLVCFYGERGTVAWWEQIDPKVTRCVVQTRDGGRDPMDARATCR